jgi:aryl-alcohol dehydrogenase-like predicted oxidoreductase
VSSKDFLSRRDALKLGAMAGAGVALGRFAISDVRAAAAGTAITKTIPSSGEKLPVVGLGTNAYGVTNPEDLAARKEVLRKMAELGGTVIDTAPAYGRSEEVIGNLLAELGNRSKYFLATKVTAPGGDAAQGKAMLEESFKRLKTDHIELIEVHSLNGMDEMIPVLLEMKARQRIKYLGATTSSDSQHGELAAAMKKFPLDFVQVNYSIEDRESAAQILPLAIERKCAVLANIPFGGRRGANALFSKVANTKLPDWAAEIEVTTWAQFFLKYVVSHPAVTAAIPGITKATHLEDNQTAGHGKIPDAATRAKMEKFWDALS